MTSKLDYLKRYMSNDDEQNGSKKKKKKKKVKDPGGFKIIDNDNPIVQKIGKKDKKGDDDEDNKEALALMTTQEELPQVAGVVDDSRMRTKFTTGGWKDAFGVKEEPLSGDETVAGKYSGVNIKEENLSPDRDENSPPRRRRHDSGADTSPPRRRRHDSDADNSPPRKRRHDSDADTSPPRRRRHDSDADNSPPRQRRHDSDADTSPPRRQRHDSDANNSPKIKRSLYSEVDNSPPRRRRHDSDGDNSPPRKRRHGSDADNSPPRRGKLKIDEDISPPRRRRNDSDNSPPRRTNAKEPNSDSDNSPPRRIKTELRDDEDLSPPRKSGQGANGEMKMTLDGKKAGLQKAKALKEELEFIRKKEKATFENLSSDISGRNAATKVRGRLKNQAEDEKEKQEKSEALRREAEAKYSRWNRGVKQLETAKAKVAEDLHEMDKPLARDKNDADLDSHLKNIERVEDPMLEYMRKKKKTQKAVAGLPEFPRYKGPQPPPNRFGIEPGYRWDGVDRSTGFERRLFESQNKKKALAAEAHAWSTEDM